MEGERERERERERARERERERERPTLEAESSDVLLDEVKMLILVVL